MAGMEYINRGGIGDVIAVTSCQDISSRWGLTRNRNRILGAAFLLYTWQGKKRDKMHKTRISRDRLGGRSRVLMENLQRASGFRLRMAGGGEKLARCCGQDCEVMWITCGHCRCYAFATSVMTRNLGIKFGCTFVAAHNGCLAPRQHLYLFPYITNKVKIR